MLGDCIPSVARNEITFVDSGTSLHQSSLSTGVVDEVQPLRAKQTPAPLVQDQLWADRLDRKKAFVQHTAAALP